MTIFRAYRYHIHTWKRIDIANCFLWTDFVFFRFIIISSSDEHQWRVCECVCVCTRESVITFIVVCFILSLELFNLIVLYGHFSFSFPLIRCYIFTYTCNIFILSTVYSYGLHHFPGFFTRGICESHSNYVYK